MPQIEVLGEKMSIRECQVSGTRSARFVIDQSLKTGTDFSSALFFSKALVSDDRLRYPPERRVAVVTESPIDPALRKISWDKLGRDYSTILTHQIDLVAKGHPYQLLHFGTNWVGVRNPAAASRALGTQAVKQRLVSFVGSVEHPDVGAYSFRRAVAERLVSDERIDRFGRGIRFVESKREAIEPYMFSIAMENAASDYYFSEKLIDCLLLDTVPIYYGCPGIGTIFDARGFLCFATIEQLEGIIDRLSPELYQQMIPFARLNKRIAVDKGFYGHHSLLQRVLECLPEEMFAESTLTYRPLSRFEGRLRSLLSMPRRPRCKPTD